MIRNFDKTKFHEDLKCLGIMPHDTVLINLNIEKFGLLKGFKRSDYVGIFIDYFEQGGGMFFSLAFTPSSFSISNKNIHYFDGTQPAYTGAFPNAMLKNKNSFRSTHPTNSIVAIGHGAKEFVEGLDERSGAYTFARKLIEKEGKVLLIGMVDYPGFLTHLVEQDLKLYKKYWNRFFLKVKLKNSVYKRKDPGGCSKTFERLYPEYIKQEALRIGTVNNAYSLAIDAVDAYRIDYAVVSKNPAILICNDKKCHRCRLFQWKYIWKLPLFVMGKIVSKTFTKLRG